MMKNTHFSIENKNNLKESYFVQSNPPESLSSPQFFASNSDASIFYTLKREVQIRLVDENQQLTPEIRTEVKLKEICKYHVMSGQFSTFRLDDDIDFEILTRIIEMYPIGPNIIVLISYDPEKYCFTQFVLHLNQSLKYAPIIAYRKLTVTRILGPPFINLSLVDSGRLLICGARGLENGKSIPLSLSISSDPLSSHRIKDEDFSEKLNEFNEFVTLLPFEKENQRKIGLFVLSVDEQNITILLSTVGDVDGSDEPLFVTDCFGLIDRKTNHFSVENVNNEAVVDQLKVESLRSFRVRNSNAYLSFAVTDCEQLNTIFWRFKLFYVKVFLRLMIAGLRTTLYLWKYDNGLSFRVLAFFLQCLHGPSMMPTFNPQKKFCLYFLNLRQKQFFRVQHAAKPLKNRENPNETEFAINYDVDSSGGALIFDFSTKNQTNLGLSYYPNPTKPRTLSRMAMYSAYRNYPSFEKSSLLRKLTGVTDWKWNI